jgi:hypothetical protein
MEKILNNFCSNLSSFLSSTFKFWPNFITSLCSYDYDQNILLTVTKSANSTKLTFTN